MQRHSDIAVTKKRNGADNERRAQRPRLTTRATQAPGDLDTVPFTAKSNNNYSDSNASYKVWTPRP